MLVGQLGDGEILLVDGSRQVVRPIASDPSNFADETASLCQNEAWASIHLRTTPAPDGELLLLLSTDGYSKSYETDAIFELIGPDYLDMLREQGAAAVEQQLDEILAAVSVGGSGDDIAFGMLHWASPIGAVAPREDVTAAAVPSEHPGGADVVGDAASGDGVGSNEKGD